jgi:hypothetical protein
MISSLRTLMSLSPAAVLLLTQCSLNHLAGGSGAGNPGGSVTVSLKAQISIGMNKSVADTSSGILIFGNPTDSPVVIYDKTGIPFSMSEIMFTCADFRFLLDQSEDPEKILESMKDPSPLLTHDDFSLILRGGPYMCNGLTGKVLPEIKSITIPIAKYTGMMIPFKKEWNSNVKSDLLYLSGTIPYFGKNKRLVVDIDLSFYSFINFDKGIFTPSTSDTTCIELLYDAKRWFENVDIKGGIESGAIYFDQDGDLIIGRQSNSSATENIEMTIINSFMASGKLAVRTE